MTDLAMFAAPSSVPPQRHLVAVGSIRQHGGRTTRILATAYGATGSITPAGACPTCRGRGGHASTTRDRATVRTHWVRCGTCRGTGAAR